ncbi:MAG: Rpn family recombination-promoting nuclease/putative transposase [Chitinispirillaceae bacterium]
MRGRGSDHGKISGKQCYIYLLFEHKSYSDRFSGFQLLRNMVKIWENYLKQRKVVTKLPLVLSIIIYQRKQVWSFQSSIGHLFEDIENTKEYIPEFRSEVYDISHITDESVRGAILLRVLFLTQSMPQPRNIR